MLTFKPVAQRDMSRLRRYYKDCDYQLCEYSALVKLMWRGICTRSMPRLPAA